MSCPSRTIGAQHDDEAINRATRWNTRKNRSPVPRQSSPCVNSVTLFRIISQRFRCCCCVYVVTSIGPTMKRANGRKKGFLWNFEWKFLVSELKSIMILYCWAELRRFNEKFVGVMWTLKLLNFWLDPFVRIVAGQLFGYAILFPWSFRNLGECRGVFGFSLYLKTVPRRAFPYNDAKWNTVFF